MKNFKVDKLEVKSFDTRREMGEVAAFDIKSKFCELLQKKEIP